MKYVKSKTSLRGNKLKMEWPRAWKINPATVTDRRGGNDRPYEYHGGTMLFYLYMSNEAEAPRTPTDGGKPAAASIGVLRMRLDGFVSFGSTHYAQRASIRTQPLVMSGDELRVNVDSISGAMWVAIMDPTSQDPGSEDLAVFAGFGLNQSIVLSTNSINATVSWTNASVSSLANKPLVLHFELMEAELYAFQFVKMLKTDDRMSVVRRAWNN